jgi:hypothetical protein
MGTEPRRTSVAGSMGVRCGGGRPEEGSRGRSYTGRSSAAFLVFEIEDDDDDDDDDDVDEEEDDDDGRRRAR